MAIRLGPMNLDEYMSHDATGLAELVAAKEVTPKELLALARKRAQQVNGKLNAIVIPVDREADAQVKGDLSGPFAGVPFLISLDAGEVFQLQAYNDLTGSRVRSLDPAEPIAVFAGSKYGNEHCLGATDHFFTETRRCKVSFNAIATASTE